MGCVQYVLWFYSGELIFSLHFVIKRLKNSHDISNQLYVFAREKVDKHKIRHYNIDAVYGL